MVDAPASALSKVCSCYCRSFQSEFLKRRVGARKGRIAETNLGIIRHDEVFSVYERNEKVRAERYERLEWDYPGIGGMDGWKE